MLGIWGLGFTVLAWGQQPSESSSDFCFSWSPNSKIQINLHNISLVEVWGAVKIFRPQLRLAANEVEIKQLQTIANAAGYLPTLDVSAHFENQTVESSTEDQNLLLSSESDPWSTRWVGTFRWNLYNGGKDQASVQRSQVELKESHWRFQTQTIDAIWETSNTYGNLLVHWTTLQQLQQEIPRLQGRLQRVMALLERGSGTRQKVNDTLYDLAQKQKELHETELLVIEASDSLSVLMGKRVADQQVFRPVDSHLPLTSTRPTVTNVEELLVHHPRIQVAQAQSQQAAIEIKQNQALFLPSVDFQIQEIWQGSDPDALEPAMESTRFQRRTVGLALNHNLFSGYRDQAKLKMTHLNWLKSKVEAEYVLQQLRQETRAALQAMRTHASTLEMHKTTYRQVLQNIDLQKALLKAGQGTRDLVEEAESKADQLQLLTYRLEIQHRLHGWRVHSFLGEDHFETDFETQIHAHSPHSKTDCLFGKF
ncbi:TolC family protein [Deltaproteobacteria bacterium TL4]